MAYIAFQDFGGETAGRHAYRAGPSSDPVPSGAGSLTALEWSVVTIARKDGRASLRRPGRMSTALRALFNQPNPQLADARLEALRRMAVLTWRDGYTVPSHEVRAFLDAGFAPAQYETLVDRVSAAKIIPPRTVIR